MKNLEKFPFFTQLSLQEKKELMFLLNPFSAKKGEIIHYQGDTCQNSLLLCKGSVRLYSQANDFSEELTLYILHEGEQCLSQVMEELNNPPIIPSAVAQSDIEGYLVNREALEAFIARIPAYQSFVISLYAKKIAELTKALQSIKFKNLDDRIMDYLRSNELNNYRLQDGRLV